MTVSKTRSLAKAILYRGLGTVSTFLIAWIFTGQLMVATGIAAIEFFVKTALYYLYERFWNLISWGRSDN